MGSNLPSLKFDVTSTFNDSLINIIDGKEFIYYIKGHHGHIWCLLTLEKDCYILVKGNTRNNNCQIDTISINNPILSWGLDTMPMYYNKIKQSENKSYWPFYSRLVVFSAEKEIVFDYSDNDLYRGGDSVKFNKKLNELKYFLYWLATPPDIQEKLPVPL